MGGTEVQETRTTPAFVVHIGGYPGIGKLTVARAMARLLGNVRLVDNHTAYVDAASALFPIGSNEWTDLVATLREAVYNAAERVDIADALVFTDVLYHGWGDDDILRRIETIAENRGVPFLAVTLTASPEVHRRRLTRRRTPNKLRSWRSMRRTLAMFVPLRPDPGFHEFKHLEIDTTELTPEETAKCIAARLLEMSDGEKCGEDDAVVR